MSYIASFYLINEDDVETIANSAEVTPQPKKMFGIFPKKTIDTKELFWKTLWANAIKLDEFQYSGFAFVEFITMYPDFPSYSKSSFGSRLSNAMESTYLSFTTKEARTSIVALGSCEPSSEIILDYFKEEGREDEFENWETPIKDAWNILVKWLNQVEEGKIGLLSIG